MLRKVSGIKTIATFYACLLLVCGVLGASGISGMLESDSVKNATGQRVFKHNLSNEKRGTELRLTSNLTAGTAVWQVRDASGKLVWSETIGKGDLVKTQRFEGTPGVWSVEVSFQDATGRYKLRLKDF
jgi:hypothetical protein